MGNNGNGKTQWGRLDPNLLDPTGGQVNERPILPGFEGLPFRGSVPNIKETDPDHLQPQVGYKAHVEILDLSKPKELERYRDVCQMITNGFGQISQERIEYNKTKKSWLIFIRWLEGYTYDPSKGHNHGRYR